MLMGSFEKLFQDGCIMTGADKEQMLQEAKKKYARTFYELMVATNCMPCERCPMKMTECSAYKRNNVKALIKKKPPQVGTEKYPNMTVKQIAELLGISKNEVRRRKHEGTL